MRKTIIVLLCLSILVGCATLVLHHVEPRTAPSLTIALLGCTNRTVNLPMVATSAPPLAWTGLMTATNEAEIEIFNRGSRPAKISNVSIQFRSISGSRILDGISTQRILRGCLGTVEPGKSRKFLIQFDQQLPVGTIGQTKVEQDAGGDVTRQVGLSHFAGGGQICGTCEVEPFYMG